VEWIDIYDQRMQHCIACMKSGQVLTKKFVARLRKRYLPEKYDKEIAGHRQSAACLDTEKRDLIVYLIWQTGLLTNEKIGAIFDLTYSSVSHSVRAVKARMAKDHKFRDYFEGLNSQFKV
jgi:chromosomal replication initiation ATPase DnaA